MSRFPLSALATILALLFVFAGQAEAHARLVSSTPESGATVSAPQTITLTFSERAVPAFSGFDLVNIRGEKLPVRTQVSQNGLTLSGVPSRPLASGSYRLEWHLASADGHRMTGTLNFTVR